MIKHQICFTILFVFASALYDSSDSVVELTASNFKTRVENDDAIWIVEFYAPWYDFLL